MNSTFKNRLEKKRRLLAPWAEREGLEAWRVYDRDTPEIPVAVDLYGGHVHVSEFPRRRARREGTGALRSDVTQAIGEVLAVPSDRVHWKTHVPQLPAERL